MVNQCITISFFQKLHVIGEISKVLNTHAPKKVKIIRGNHKPHYNKNLRKAFIKRSRLKNKTNRSKDPVDIANYKKQRNLVVSLNVKQSLNVSMKIQIPKAEDPFGKPASRTFQINMLAEILRLCSLKMIKCY